jgi:hypothetical protein
MTMMIPQLHKSFRHLSTIIIILLLLHGKSRAFFLIVPARQHVALRKRLATTTASSLARGGPSASLLSVSARSLDGDARRLRRLRSQRRMLVIAAAVPRYGPTSTGSKDGTSDNDDSSTVVPPPSSSSSSSSSSSQKILSESDQANFKRLVQQVMSVRDAQHIPSLLTQNMELLFAVIGASGGEAGVALVQDILNDFPDDMENNDVDASSENESDSSSSSSTSNNSATGASRRQVEETIDLMLSFAQDFVDQASELDNQNKRLLGKIIKVISPARDNSNSNNNNTPKTAWEREEALDKLLEQEREFLTAGFLRHLQGECKRIANAPTLTRESSRLLEVLSMIQTRVLEEMAMHHPSHNEENGSLGEAALVLGQLIGYESKAERLAVLEAGLLVRNNNNNNGSVDFAQQMRDLTLEALDGFTRVVGGADPGLVQIIQEIDARLEEFIASSKRNIYNKNNDDNAKREKSKTS